MNRKPKNATQLLRIVAQFNRRWPVGSPVIYSHPRRGEISTTVEKPAEIISRIAVGWFKGVPCAQSIEDNRVRDAEPVEAAP